jgi:hypothetical protein
MPPPGLIRLGGAKCRWIAPRCRLISPFVADAGAACNIAPIGVAGQKPNINEAAAFAHKVDGVV